MKLIIGVILSLIIGISLYVVVHILADKYAKDLFEWGYLTGLLFSCVIDVILKIFK